MKDLNRAKSLFNFCHFVLIQSSKNKFTSRNRTNGNSIKANHFQLLDDFGIVFREFDEDVCIAEDYLLLGHALALNVSDDISRSCHIPAIAIKSSPEAPTFWGIFDSFGRIST